MWCEVCGVKVWCEVCGVKVWCELYGVNVFLSFKVCGWDLKDVRPLTKLSSWSNKATQEKGSSEYFRHKAKLKPF